MNKVKVTANAEGQVINVSKNNPEYGYIRVEQTRMVVDDNNFVTDKTISTLVFGSIESLKKFGWKNGQEIDGKIIFKESLTPFNKKNPESDYKIAGKSGIVCTIDGSPIYRKNFYSQKEVEDVYIRDEQGNILTHNNQEEIKAAYKEVEQLEEFLVEDSVDATITETIDEM